MEIIITVAALVYVAMWWTAIFHFNSRFKYFKFKWEEARDLRNHKAMAFYYRCEELAHKDTGRAGLFTTWFRWSADYEAEASKELSR